MKRLVTLFVLAAAAVVLLVAASYFGPYAPWMSGPGGIGDELHGEGVWGPPIGDELCQDEPPC